MMAQFGPAAEAYSAASAIATSDPDVQAAECELWIQIMLASSAKPDELRASFERANPACEKAALASSRGGAGRLKLALAYQGFAWNMVNYTRLGDPEPILHEAITRAEEAAKSEPGDAMAYYLIGASSRTELFYLMNRKLDATAAIDRAITAYEEAIRLDPTFQWAHNELCSIYVRRATTERWRGIDPTRSVELAIAQSDRAIALDPSFAYPLINRALAHLHMAEYLAERGRSPEAAIKSMLSACAALHEKNPEEAALLSVWAYQVEAAYEIDSGGDPSASLGRLAEFIETRAKAASKVADDEITGLIAITSAQHVMRQGGDPSAALERARAVFRRLAEASPWDAGYRVSQARIEKIALAWASKNGKIEEAQVDAALSPLLPLLDRERADPSIYQSVAEIRQRSAERLVAKRASEDRVEAEIREGLAMAERALAINPKMASALATKGELLLLRARAARAGREKGLAASAAIEALEAAIRENPWLEREAGPALKEARLLLGK